MKTLKPGDICVVCLDEDKTVNPWTAQELNGVTALVLPWKPPKQYKFVPQNSYVRFRIAARKKVYYGLTSFLHPVGLTTMEDENDG